MAPLSEFEKQRQENIKRNQELLRSLNLDSIHDSISRDAAVPNGAAKRKKTATRSTTTKTKSEPVEPTRRSRRLAGVKVENTEEFNRLQREQEELERKKKEIEKLKQTRLFGEFHISDLLTTSKGDLKNEEKILGKIPDDGHVKLEDMKNITSNKSDENEESNEKEQAALNILKNLGEKFSAGDFYQLIRDKNDENESLEDKRKEFDDLKIYEKFDPLDIKITHQRISSIAFHPAIQDRVIVAGDTVGDLGVWAVDSREKEDEPSITIVKPHGKVISKLLTPMNQPTQIISASYDGSVRSLDLNKLESSELAYLNDPYDDNDVPLGVSDINFCGEDDVNVLYFTTLSGNFYRHDTRMKFKLKESELLRLHDKKIGSFAINPNLSHQIATASLDRSLRIWDLRNISQKNGSWSEFEDQKSPFRYGTYESRLSVSCVDWNKDNHLVSNGYDDQICIFDLSGCESWTKTYQMGGTNEKGVLTPFTKIRHNCQTGRWVSILKSKWQLRPQDGVQKFAIANMNRGIDIYNQKGDILAHLAGPNVGAVPAVVSMHPTKNWVVGGSASGKLYLFE